MKKLVLALLLGCAWAVGIHSGDCTFAVVFSLIPLLNVVEMVQSTINGK